MKKTIILSLLSLISLYEIYSQVEAFKTFPVAPSGYEFLKYGEFPVSKYSGVPNITVPIYTIDTGSDDLKIPITLTYHSTGFSVNEEAGWTGLGWTLNEGGTIVQVVNGYDDFKTGYDTNRELFDIDKVIHHASNGSAPENYWTATKCSQGQTYAELSNTRFSLPVNYTGTIYQNQILNVPNMLRLFGQGGHYDFEPDVFNFNFLGYSGKFVLDWETETFKCLTDPKIKVDKKPNSYNQITITTPDGHIFEFSVKDESISIDGYIGVTSRIYKLDNIYTKKGQQINYTYVKTNVVNNFPAIIKSVVTDPINNMISTSNELNTKQTLSYVDKIRFNNGKGEIEFVMSDRLDFVGTKKLDGIKIKVIKSNTATKIIKQFNFNYSYFVGHSNGTVVAFNNYFSTLINKNSEEYTHRLKLDSLVESGKPPYVFQYNQTPFPKKNSRARDYWGYYNGFLTNSTTFPNIRRFNYEFLPNHNGWPNFNRYNGVDNLDIFEGNNRSSRLTYTKAGILEKIIFPTGGFTTFDYELNSFTNCIVPSFEDTENTQYESNRISYGAGLRISEIKNFDTNYSLLSRKKYTYNGGTLTNPLLFYNQIYLKHADNQYTKQDGWRKMVKATNFNTPSLNSSGNIGYSEVIEYFNSSKDISQNIGSIKYVFQNKKPKMWIDPSRGLITEAAWKSSGKYAELNLPLYHTNLVYNPKNGSLLEQLIFDKNQILKQKVENTYLNKINDYCTYGTRVGPMIIKKALINTIANLEGRHIEVAYMLGGYTIGGVHTNLKESKTTNYFNNNDSLVTKNEYLYDKYWQVKEKIFTNSKNETLTTKIYYPEDVVSYYNLGLPHLNSSEKKAIDSLKATAKHRINTPIQTETYKNDILTSKQRNVFKVWTWGNIVELQKVQSSKSENNLEDRFIYHKYDDKGNPLEVSKERGLHSVFIWGYNQTKLIAKIENFTYDELMRYNYNSGKAILSSIYSTSNNDNDRTVDTRDSLGNVIAYNGKEGKLREALQDLRSARALSNTQVTTYTYDPLIGVTSMTDPKGYTIYYEYDELNRLKQVKDADGNILSNNQYNYKN